jgi:hypothetical protein
LIVVSLFVVSLIVVSLIVHILWFMYCYLVQFYCVNSINIIC